MDFLRNKWVLGFLVLLVIVGVWYGFGDSSTESLLSTDEPAISDPTEREITTTLLALRSIQLKGTIFADPTFRGLQDFSTEIVPEPVGRPDPFAPLYVNIPAATDTAMFPTR